MATKPGEQPVDEKTRDSVFAEMKDINENNKCIDCDKKNPKWASIPLGIHLCYDCAGKHRQYGVVISFVKSVNLDVWNHRQILFMQKGGNSRALEYFRKRGIITAANRTIDYKSQIVKQYKDLLAQQVDSELLGGKKEKKVESEKKAIDDFFNELEQKPVQQKKIEIATAEVVDAQADKPKKKKEKKKLGANKINLQDFQNIAFDDGVPTQQKEKIVKEYEKKKDIEVNQQSSNKAAVFSSLEPQTPKIEEPKQLSQEQIKKKMEELKLQSNLKNISSDSFKDNSIDNVTLKQNLNKFSGSTSISSAAFFNKEEEPSGQALDNLKGLVTNVGAVGQNLFNKLSGYWKK